MESFENDTLRSITEDDDDTRLIADLVISGPRLDLKLDRRAHLHEAARYATEAQPHIIDLIGGPMKYCRRLQPYRPLQSRNTLIRTRRFTRDIYRRRNIRNQRLSYLW